MWFPGLAHDPEIEVFQDLPIRIQRNDQKENRKIFVSKIV